MPSAQSPIVCITLTAHVPSLPYINPLLRRSLSLPSQAFGFFLLGNVVFGGMRGNTMFMCWIYLVSIFRVLYVIDFLSVLSVLDYFADPLFVFDLLNVLVPILIRYSTYYLFPYSIILLICCSSLIS